jgi:hypothetical protein
VHVAALFVVYQVCSGVVSPDVPVIDADQQVASLQDEHIPVWQACDANFQELVKLPRGRSL